MNRLTSAVASLDKMDICKWLTNTQWYVPNVSFEEKPAWRPILSIANLCSEHKFAGQEGAWRLTGTMEIMREKIFVL